MGIGLYYLHSLNRNRGLGIEQNNWLGLGHYQLCLVGRYWSRRYTNFSRMVAFPSKVENGSKPFCRGDDNFCRGAGRVVSYYPHGPSMAGLLGAPHSEPIRVAMG